MGVYLTDDGTDYHYDKIKHFRMHFAECVEGKNYYSEESLLFLLTIMEKFALDRIHVLFSNTQRILNNIEEESEE